MNVERIRNNPSVEGLGHFHRRLCDRLLTNPINHLEYTNPSMHENYMNSSSQPAIKYPTRQGKNKPMLQETGQIKEGKWNTKSVNKHKLKLKMKHEWYYAHTLSYVRLRLFNAHFAPYMHQGTWNGTPPRRTPQKPYLLQVAGSSCEHAGYQVLVEIQNQVHIKSPSCPAIPCNT